MNFPVSRSAAAFAAPLALVLFSSSSGAAAQAADTALAPVVVTAAGIEQLQTEALPHTTVISADRIRDRQAPDLPTLLRQEAGIQFTRSGGIGQPTSVFMRGAQPGETLILIDGIPLRRQGFAVAPALEHILPEQIERIEIVRGNVSAIYGTGAIGGVIQIFTKTGNGAPGATVSAEIGSQDTRRLSGSLSGQAGNTRYALSATHLRSDGISANNTDQYPNENPDDDGYRNDSVSASLSHEWRKGHEFGARLYANDADFRFDGGGFGTPTDADSGSAKQRTLAVFSRNRMTEDWLSTLTLSETETRDESISISPTGYVIRDDSDTTMLQWNNEIALTGNWTMTAGAEARRERMDAFSDYGFGASTAAYSRSTSSVHAGVLGTFGAHQLQANLRHDRVGGAGSDTTGFLGYGYALTQRLKLIASASSAFNAPSLAQLHDPLSGNPDLRAERSRSYEIGAQYASGDTLLRATLFRTRIRDQFATDPDNCFSGAYPASCPSFNFARTKNAGVELSASTSMAGFDLAATLTRQRPEDESTGDILFRRARTTVSFSAARDFGAWRLGFDAAYTGSRPDRDFAAPRDLDLGAYWLANMTLRYQASKNLALFGRIENLFDSEDQTVYGYNQPPRGVFVGVSWKY